MTLYQNKLALFHINTISLHISDENMLWLCVKGTKSMRKNWKETKGWDKMLNKSKIVREIVERKQMGERKCWNEAKRWEKMLTGSRKSFIIYLHMQLFMLSELALHDLSWILSYMSSIHFLVKPYIIAWVWSKFTKNKLELS